MRSQHTKRMYGRALEEFASWTREQGIESFTKAAVQGYLAWLTKKGLAPSSINVHLAALRKLAAEASDKAFLDPQVAAGIARIRGASQKGRRTGRWLTREQASDLLRDRDDSSLKWKRDRAILCLLIGSGLRRQELATLRIEHVQMRDDRWVILDLTGKRQRIRTVPIPAWAKDALDRWTHAACITAGPLFRAIDKAGRINSDSLSTQAIYLTVRDHARAIGLTLAPHDARRTFAKLAHQGGVPLEQIQLSLGHDSILTTEKYLGVRQDLKDAPCDHLRLDLR
jgi:site-specific recombinase XerD